VQPSPTAALGSVQTLTVDLSAGPQRVDLDAGALTTSDTDWDLRISDFAIRVNGGVSGPGKGGAASESASFESITSAKIADQAYRTDVYAGVFGAHRFYRYNIAGDNRISPTFDVYLLRRGNTAYKLQVLNYYNPASPTQARYITFRYEQIAG
jgi:hypothetical protein